MPAEVRYYTPRVMTGWRWVGLLLIICHFAVPFFTMFSRDAKRNPIVLARVAVLVLVMRAVDWIWLIEPSVRYNMGNSPHAGMWFLTDLLLLVGLGGIWLAYFCWQMSGRLVLPLPIADEGHHADAATAAAAHGPRTAATRSRESHTAAPRRRGGRPPWLAISTATTPARTISPAGYEGNDLRRRLFLIFAGAFVVFGAVIQVIVWLLLAGMQDGRGRRTPCGSPPPVLSQSVMDVVRHPPPPNLQPSPVHPRVACARHGRAATGAAAQYGTPAGRTSGLGAGVHRP